MQLQILNSGLDDAGNYFFIVSPNANQPNAAHRVTRDTDGNWVCTCVGRPQPCEHISRAWTEYAETRQRMNEMREQVHQQSVIAKERQRRSLQRAYEEIIRRELEEEAKNETPTFTISPKRKFKLED